MSLLRWLFGKTTSNWDLVTWLAGSVWTLVGGVVIGWAAWAAGIFSHYAPFSWAAAGLIGTIIAAFVFWLIAKGYFWYTQARWARMASSPGDGVNPLDDNFLRKRIKIGDFTSRVNPLIEHKTFDRCELIGPALVLAQGVSFVRSGFTGCNFMCCKDNFPIFGATILKDSNIINSKLFEITFVVPESQVDKMIGLPSEIWLSRIPSEFNQPASNLKPPPQLLSPPGQSGKMETRHEAKTDAAL